MRKKEYDQEPPIAFLPYEEVVSRLTLLLDNLDKGINNIDPLEILVNTHLVDDITLGQLETIYALALRLPNHHNHTGIGVLRSSILDQASNVMRKNKLEISKVKISFKS